MACVRISHAWSPASAGLRHPPEGGRHRDCFTRPEGRFFRSSNRKGGPVLSTIGGRFHVDRPSLWLPILAEVCPTHRYTARHSTQNPQGSQNRTGCLCAFRELRVDRRL